jgi:hypothetical protein
LQFKPCFENLHAIANMEEFSWMLRKLKSAFVVLIMAAVILPACVKALQIASAPADAAIVASATPAPEQTPGVAPCLSCCGGWHAITQAGLPVLPAATPKPAALPHAGWIAAPVYPRLTTLQRPNLRPPPPERDLVVLLGRFLN